MIRLRSALVAALAAACAVQGAPPPVRLTLDLASPGPRVPEHFLGLSFEKDELSGGTLDPRDGALVQLLAGLGPGVLRLGGDSVDSLALEGDGPRLAAGCKIDGEIRRADLARMLALLRASDWKLLYGLNLGCADGPSARREARFVRSAAGDRLLAFEMGNEPDFFVRKGLRQEPWGIAQYLPQVHAFQEELRRLDPGLPLCGPSVGSFLAANTWLPPYLDAEAPGLAMAGLHFYPMVRLESLGAAHPMYPTIPHMLSRRIAAWMVDEGLAPQLAALRAAGVPWRVTETNSAAHSGKVGVSDVFAAALWVVDLGLRFLELGASGIHLQCDLDNLHDVYSPIQDRGRGAEARPPYWGMLLLSRALAGHRVPLARDPEPGTPGAPRYAAAATGGAGRKAALVLLNLEESEDLRVEVTASGAGASTTGRVLRLQAPGLTAQEGITLGGAALGPTGRLGPVRWEACPGQGEVWTVALPRASAALVELVAAGP